MSKSIMILYVLVIALVPLDAFAYLDAGTGSMIIQGIIGGVAAGFIFLRPFWGRLLEFFGIRKKEKNLDDVSIDNEK